MDNVTFQSGTPATPPDLTVVSTEEVTTLNGAGVSAQQIQRIVAAVRTADGVAIDLPASTADGLLVNLGANNDVTVTGTVQSLGTYQPLAGSVHVANTAAILGTVQLHGTGQQLGTYQPLAGSVHLASGTVSVLGTVQTHGTNQALGSIQLVGTNQALGTVQPLAGSVHLATNLAGGSVVSVGSLAVGILAGAAMRPLLMGAVGSSGTQAAQGDGSITQLWTDLNGRLQVRGTIDSIPSITIGAALPAGNNNIGDVDIASMPTVTVTATNLDIRDLTSASDSVSVVGTTQPLAGSVHVANIAGVIGTVQTHGTSQILGTVQTVAGMAFGSVQGWQAHDGAAAGNPLLMAAFGSSGTQDAVGNGDAVRLWADLNGRLQVRGTIDSIPNITITAGTVSLNTGGTMHVGSVQSIAGTVQALGTVATRLIATGPLTTRTRIAITANSIIQLVGLNANRAGFTLFSETSPMFIQYGTTAGTFDYTLQMSGGAYFEDPYRYTGSISAFSTVAGGTVQVTEF